MKTAAKLPAKPARKAAASRPKTPPAAPASPEPRGEAAWSESRGVEHEIEEREAERLARQAAEELEEEEGVPGAAVPEEEAEW
jgi:hypothetical protein